MRELNSADDECGAQLLLLLPGTKRKFLSVFSAQQSCKDHGGGGGRNEIPFEEEKEKKTGNEMLRRGEEEGDADLEAKLSR